MKNILSSVVIVIAMFFAINGISYSQLCDPCPGTNWQSAQNLILADIFGCVLLVDFDYKVCPNGRRIIKITRIEFVDPNQCNGAMIEPIMNQAIRGVLRYSAGTFQIPDPSNPFEVTVITPMCWHMQSSYMAACSADSCCSTDYTLRAYNENYELTQEPITYEQAQVCTTAVGGSQCIKMCDAHYIPPNEPIFRRTYEPYCVTNCNEPWERLSSNFISAVLQPNCFIRAYYDVRICPNGQYQFSIYKIEYDDDCATEVQIIQKSVRAILNRIYQLTQRTDTIYGIHQSCWKKIEGNPKDYLIQCHYWSDCCIMRYRIDTIQNPYRARVTPISNPNVQCYGICQNRCSTFDINNQPIPKLGAKLEQPTNIYDDLSINPNPAENKLNILINSSHTGNIKIKIFNALGDLVESIIIPVHIGTKLYELKTDSYGNGIYYYQAEFPDGNIKRGNFIINK